nr:hypothetical protein [Actinomadura violacea]
MEVERGRFFEKRDGLGEHLVGAEEGAEVVQGLGERRRLGTRVGRDQFAPNGQGLLENRESLGGSLRLGVRLPSDVIGVSESAGEGFRFVQRGSRLGETAQVPVGLAEMAERECKIDLESEVRRHEVTADPNGLGGGDRPVGVTESPMAEGQVVQRLRQARSRLLGLVGRQIAEGGDGLLRGLQCVGELTGLPETDSEVEQRAGEVSAVTVRFRCGKCPSVDAGIRRTGRGAFRRPGGWRRGPCQDGLIVRK